MTYADSVLAAIQYSDGPKGVSLAAIRKYFTAETTLDPKSVHLTKALKKLEATSKIIKVTSASYTMTVMAVQNTKPPTVSTSKPAGKRAKSVPMPPPPPADDDDNEEEEEEEVQGDIEVLGPLDDDEVLRIGEVAIVESSSGGQYEVVRDSATTWHCTCKSFRFCKKENWVDGERTCKHLEGVRSGEIEPLDIIPASKPPIAPIAPIAPTKKSSKKSTKKSAGGDDGVPFSFSALSAEKIKDCLRLNDQLLKGNKGEIIERADERYANGALARCPGAWREVEVRSQHRPSRCCAQCASSSIPRACRVWRRQVQPHRQRATLGVPWLPRRRQIPVRAPPYPQHPLVRLPALSLWCSPLTHHCHATIIQLLPQLDDHA